MLSAFLHVEHEEELLRAGTASAEDDLARESNPDLRGLEPRNARAPRPLLHLKGDG
jgi:hypothetical protein